MCETNSLLKFKRPYCGGLSLIQYSLHLSENPFVVKKPLLLHHVFTIPLYQNIGTMSVSPSLQGPFLFIFLLFLSLSPGFHGFKITGALGGVNSTTGARPLRYEIHEFANSGPAFDLLVLSMMAFQAANQSEPLSYFQISGFKYPLLHSLPRLITDRHSWVPSGPLGRRAGYRPICWILSTQRCPISDVASALYGALRGAFGMKNW